MRQLPPFVQTVVSTRDLVVTNVADHAWRLEPRRSVLAWHCDLDDGTPTGENDPASFVRWVCPGLRVAGSTTGPELDVRRRGAESDLGRVLAWLGRRAGRPTNAGTADRFTYTDPHGILDPQLRQRIENWPPAAHGDGVERPAELSSIRVNREGLVVESASWWDSAAALDHQVHLATDIADRLALRR